MLSGRRTVEQVDHCGEHRRGVRIFAPSHGPPGKSAMRYPLVTYVDDGVASAMAQAKAAAGDCNVLGHGAYTAQRVPRPFGRNAKSSLIYLARPARFERATTGLEGRRFSGKSREKIGSRDPDVTPLVEALRAIEEGHPAALRIATDALGHALTLFKKRAALSRGTVEELGSVLGELPAEKPAAAKKRKGRS